MPVASAKCYFSWNPWKSFFKKKMIFRAFRVDLDQHFFFLKSHLYCFNCLWGLLKANKPFSRYFKSNDTLLMLWHHLAAGALCATCCPLWYHTLPPVASPSCYMGERRTEVHGCGRGCPLWYHLTTSTLHATAAHHGATHCCPLHHHHAIWARGKGEDEGMGTCISKVSWLLKNSWKSFNF